MHKIETAGHAGTELGLSRLLVLKLLTGSSGIDEALKSPLEEGPSQLGGVQAVGSPALRQKEMQQHSLGCHTNMEESAKN